MKKIIRRTLHSNTYKVLCDYSTQITAILLLRLAGRY